MTVFQLVKNSVDIMDAAGRYGLDVNRHHKALCPYHNDVHPSLSFRGGRFKCFSCGAGGDVIDLVGRLANTTPLETVRELNSAYRLGIDLDKPVERIEILRLRREQERKRAVEAWEKETANTYIAYYRLLREWRSTRAPKSPYEELDRFFVESLVNMDYIDYIIDSVFIGGNLSVKQEFYRKCATDARRVKERLKEVERDAGRASANDHQAGTVRPRATPACEYSCRAA